MSPLSDETLILYYYGEVSDREGIARRLSERPEERARYEALQRALDAIEAPEAPERSEEYGAQVWARIRSRLEPARPAARRRSWWLAPQWGLAAAALALVVVAFLAGRHLSREEASPERWVVTGETRERILLAAVSGHLERTEMLLLELANSQGRGATHLAIERELAGELSSEGRLYRAAAEAAGQVEVADLLEEIERLLIDLSHGPERLSAGGLKHLQDRLEERDLLFRLRVVSARLHRASESPFDEVPRVPTT
jgi:hypothetical protein